MEKNNALRSLPVFLCLATGGCIRHQATVLETPVTNDASIAINARPTLPKAVHAQHGAMPVELRVSAYRLDHEDGLQRFEAHLKTPLPWWQRFPIDLFTDWSPLDHRATNQAIIVYYPVPTLSAQDLAQQAYDAGYGPKPLLADE